MYNFFRLLVTSYAFSNRTILFCKIQKYNKFGKKKKKKHCIPRIPFWISFTVSWIIWKGGRKINTTYKNNYKQNHWPLTTPANQELKCVWRHVRGRTRLNLWQAFESKTEWSFRRLLLKARGFPLKTVLEWSFSLIVSDLSYF